MALSYRTATRDDVDELCELDGRNFGGRFDADSVERIRESFDLSRFLVARDTSLPGDPMVGAAGNFSLEVTLPGPSVVPMAGVTWVSVAT
ncbi:MAG: GNAT family N-acetyltransferase, partial [Acidimicrobiia bacterium]|nr:GNAT family N-acetyltransferase [Acidimicrobiia bacterium]